MAEVKDKLVTVDGLKTVHDTLTNNLSNPNLLINGDFQIWQRGDGIAYTTSQITNKYTYFADRWCIYVSSAMRIDRGVNGLTFYCQGANKITQFLDQKLEIGESYVLSAKIEGVVRTLNIVGGTSCENNYLYYTANFGSHDNSGGGSGYGYVDAVGVKPVTEATIQIDWVKLEIGTKATPFVPKPYAQELSECRLYYMLLRSAPPIDYWYSYTRARLVPTWERMRTVPTITYAKAWTYNTSGTLIDTTNYTIDNCYSHRAMLTFIMPENMYSGALGLEVSLCLDADIY